MSIPLLGHFFESTLCPMILLDQSGIVNEAHRCSYDPLVSPLLIYANRSSSLWCAMVLWWFLSRQRIWLVT